MPPFSGADSLNLLIQICFHLSILLSQRIESIVVLNLCYACSVWIKIQAHIRTFYYEIVKSQCARTSFPVWPYGSSLCSFKISCWPGILDRDFSSLCDSQRYITAVELLNVERIVGKNLNIHSLAFSVFHNTKLRRVLLWWNLTTKCYL